MSQLSTENKTLSLKDLHIGQTFLSSSYQLTAEEIKRYAAQFDPQPFHMDEEKAKKTIFKGLVASGWHTASLSMRLIVDSIHLDCGLIGLGGTLKWLKPVRPGMSLRAESEIKEIRPSLSKTNQAIVSMQCVVRNEANDIMVAFTPELMVFGNESETQN